MKKFYVRFFSLVAVLLLVASNGVVAFAAENEDNIEVVQGDSVITDVVIWDNGNYICTTKELETEEIECASEGIVPYATTVSKSYEHTITDRNGAFVATFTTVVKGTYSSSSAKITSVTGTYSDAVISGLSYSTSYSGNTATVYITLNGATIGSLGYKISTSGVISQT